LDYCDPLAAAVLPGDKPALFHKLWDEDCLSTPKWKDTYWENETQGIGHILGFSRQMNRWLNDLERNGMKDILQIDQDRNSIRNAAGHGSTGFQCHGVKGSRILGRLNSKVNTFFKDITNIGVEQIPKVRQRALMLALLDACTEAK